MELNGSQSGRQSVPRLAAKQLPEMQTQVSSQPQDKLGLSTKTGPTNPFSPNKRLSELEPDQLKLLGGGSALSTIASIQGNLTIGEATPLLRNKKALESIATLMEDRPDIKVSDFVRRDRKGRVTIDPSYLHTDSMKLLKERKDLQPGDLSAMRRNFTKRFRSPRFGKEAAQKAQELLRTRPDLSPNDVQELVFSLARSSGSMRGPGTTALQMFDSAAKILSKRDNMDPERLAELAGSMTQLSSGSTNKTRQTSQAFADAVQALEKNPLREPEELVRLADTIGDHFSGQGDNIAHLRVNAFNKMSHLMTENNLLEPQHIDSVLREAKSRNPELGEGSQTLETQRLGWVVDGIFEGVTRGGVDPLQLSTFFDTPQALDLGFKKNSDENPAWRPDSGGAPVF